MSVVEIVEISVDVGHIINDQAGELGTTSLNCSFAVVQEAEVSSSEGCIFVLLFDESDAQLWRQKA